MNNETNKLSTTEIRMISKFLGYIYREHDIPCIIDDTELEVYRMIYSKTPIEIQEYKDKSGDDSLTQRYFAELPNPDFGRKKEDPLQEGESPIHWNTDLEKLSWATLNEYVTEDYFHQYKNDLGLMLSFFESMKDDYQLVLNNEKVAIYSKTTPLYLVELTSDWREGLYSVIFKYIKYYNSSIKQEDFEDIY